MREMFDVEGTRSGKMAFKRLARHRELVGGDYVGVRKNDPQKHVTFLLNKIL